MEQRTEKVELTVLCMIQDGKAGTNAVSMQMHRNGDMNYQGGA